MHRLSKNFLRRTLRELTCCAAAAVIVLAVSGVATACPTCKEGIAEADPNAQRMAAGYYYSILFMMSMPFLILGTFGTAAYRAVRKARIEQDEAAS